MKTSQKEFYQNFAVSQAAYKTALGQSYVWIDQAILDQAIQTNLTDKEMQRLCLAPTPTTTPISLLSPAPARLSISLRWRPLRTCVYPHHLKDCRRNVIKIYLNRRIGPQKGYTVRLKHGVSLLSSLFSIRHKFGDVVMLYGRHGHGEHRPA